MSPYILFAIGRVRRAQAISSKYELSYLKAQAMMGFQTLLYTIFDGSEQE